MNGHLEGSANYNMVCEERDRLRAELGTATREYYLRAQAYGREISVLRAQLAQVTAERNALQQPDQSAEYWHEVANKLGPMLHIAEKRVATLEEERKSLLDDVQALRDEIRDMRARFAETCICPACEKCAP